MGVEDERQSKATPSQAPQASAHVTTAKGSDRIQRVRQAPATKQVDAEEISGLIEMSELAVDPADKQTREMDPETFRALLRTDRGGAPTPPKPEPVVAAPRKPVTTAELMAQVDDAFADFGPDPAAPAAVLVDTEPPPVKKQALIVADHRLDTRHAAAIAPITKPPINVTVEPPAPVPEEPWLALAMSPPVDEPREPLSYRLIAALVIAILAAVAIVLFR